MESKPIGNLGQSMASLIEQYNRELMRAYTRRTLTSDEEPALAVPETEKMATASPAVNTQAPVRMDEPAEGTAAVAASVPEAPVPAPMLSAPAPEAPSPVPVPPTPAPEQSRPPLTSEDHMAEDLASPPADIPYPSTADETPETALPAEPSPEGPPAADSALTDIGYLKVRVSVARSALPIADAHITVSRETENGLLLEAVTTSNSDGFSPTLNLATVSRTLSEQPSEVTPYTPYQIRVDMPGFFSVENLHVPIYGGILSVQPVNLIALPENYQGNSLLEYPEGGPPEL